MTRSVRSTTEVSDYVIEVRPSVLLESDGPMLAVGMHLPRRSIDLPDRARLERRYEQFRAAAAEAPPATVGRPARTRPHESRGAAWLRTLD